MDMNPCDILRSENLQIEKLRVFLGNIDEFLLFLGDSFPLFQYVIIDPLILQVLELIIRPKGYIVNISW